MGDPFHVAAATVFLASDDAKFITGVSLPVEGGKLPARQERRVGAPISETRLVLAIETNPLL
jgi:hypothetical protein